MTRQGAEQVTRTELAKLRQQEALLEARLRQMREDVNVNDKNVPADGLEEGDTRKNDFRNFLKREYESGGYVRTF